MECIVHGSGGWGGDSSETSPLRQLFGPGGSPFFVFVFFLLQKLCNFRNLSPSAEGAEDAGGRRGVQGDRVGRSDLKVVCVWLCLMESLRMVGSRGSNYTIHKVLSGARRECEVCCVRRLLPKGALLAEKTTVFPWLRLNPEIAEIFSSEFCLLI